MIGTVEALRGRFRSGGSSLSEALSTHAHGYAERKRSKAVEGIWRRMEDHPLQTVALAAGIAYPLVRVVTKIPAPILLLGTGVALAGRGGSGRSEDYARVAENADDAGTSQPPDRVFRKPHVSDVDDATTSVETTEKGGRPASSGTVSGIRARAIKAGEHAAEASRAGGETLVDAIRRNPAIAGGASLLLGAALAAMLPRTRTEGRAFGEAAEDLRERARSLAAEGVEAGRRAIGAASDEAEAQNLTEAGARNAIRDGTDRVSGAIRDAADEVRDSVEGSAGAGSDDKPDSKSD
ncbi:MAG: hypothetical protein H0T41_08895 [Rhodobacteraceae bacterium]|nr:hypothetical protein [Paracoccaceae bacterium]